VFLSGIQKRARQRLDSRPRTLKVRSKGRPPILEELRNEEAEHVRMVEEIIAKLPASSKVDVEDQDDTSMRMGY